MSCRGETVLQVESKTTVGKVAGARGGGVERKVFGLGLSKTGTSSLGEALNLLGVKTIHYPYDERTFAELRSGNYRLSLLAEFQGIVDIPVVPFYKQLDALYPRSLFILTVREMEAWLRSCEMHWRLMSEWQDNFPQFKRFHDFISERVYGGTEYDCERFRFAYETHERDVRDYFRERRADLLVLDICAGEGWEKLCPFLGCEILDAPFPRANEWMHLLLQASAEIAGVIPPGASFILVDEQGFGSEFVSERKHVPFLERGGEYWGAPADARTATAEFERTRRETGAHFIVFGWPAFWWLDYYAEFAAHLCARFPCVLQNERLVVFDLRARRAEFVAVTAAEGEDEKCA